MRTLADGLAGRKDNFLALRLFAASLVIVAHSYALVLGEVRERDPITAVLGIYSGTVAVYLFFVLSGFLVTGSWLERRELRSFVISRALRLVPASFVCAVVCALLAGPLWTVLDPGSYFAHPKTWTYILQNSTFVRVQFDLPGVFEDLRRTSVNGSLWTLRHEAGAYAYVALLGVLGVLTRRWLALAVITALVLVGIFADAWMPLFRYHDARVLAGYFALGMALYLLRDRIPLTAWIALPLIALAVFTKGTAAYPWAFALALCYVALWLAYLPAIPGLERLGDPSYGIYLWGFPIQQTLVWHMPEIDPVLLSVLALPMAWLLGALSWRFVEKPALALKRRWARPRRQAARPEHPEPLRQSL
jgi:peptidoglycan/LPS O-acetylase OafA/YrhL